MPIEQKAVSLSLSRGGISRSCLTREHKVDLGAIHQETVAVQAAELTMH